ncbi:MAG: hypothetical protein AAGF46_07695 [Pseudomonadota bacterium]
MTRWIEKSGTGIEKSGTGIEKSGTGIEGAGTGIEKSGTGIEASGTGIRRKLLACSLALAFATGAHANTPNPDGELQVVVENGILTASWSIEGSVFVGVGVTDGAHAAMNLTEVSINTPNDVSRKQIVGGGTGSSTEIVGGGTGAQIVGGGTGAQIVGGGTGAQIVGGGTGAQIVGGGTGAQIVGGGTGSPRTLIVGGGTGAQGYSVTVNGDLSMEVSINCGYANVFVMDSAGYEVISFADVRVKGAANDCGGNWDDAIVYAPSEDFNR